MFERDENYGMIYTNHWHSRNSLFLGTCSVPRILTDYQNAWSNYQSRQTYKPGKISWIILCKLYPCAQSGCTMIVCSYIVNGISRYSGHAFNLPEVGFGLRVLSFPASVCMCVCVCNLSPVQDKIITFGPEGQNTLVKILIMFWVWLNFTCKVRLIHIYTILTLSTW